MQNIIRLDLGGVNSYLIKNGQEFILVDAGGPMFMDKGIQDRRQVLLDMLEEQGVTKNNLRAIILTHGDCDHAYNAHFIAEQFETGIYMGKEDLHLVHNPDPMCYQANCKYESFIMRLVFKLIGKKIERLMIKVFDDFEEFTPDGYLEEGESLSQWGFEGTIFKTPGHTKGSLCILDNRGHLICGDIFANNNKPSLAVNAEDFVVLRESAERILGEEVTTIYPGHGEPFGKGQINMK